MNLKDEWFILVHGFGNFTVQEAGSKAFGVSSDKTPWQWGCCMFLLFHGIQGANRDRGRVRGVSPIRNVSPNNLLSPTRPCSPKNQSIVDYCCRFIDTSHFSILPPVGKNTTNTCIFWWNTLFPNQKIWLIEISFLCRVL